MAITINGSTNTLTGVAVGGLPDGIVDTDMLAANAVTVAKATGSVKGITEFDHWYLTTSVTSDQTITSNIIRNDRNGMTPDERIGTGMSQSSGIFTFPSTGKYIVLALISFVINGSDSVVLDTMVTVNNSSYTAHARATDGSGSGTRTGAGSSLAFIDVTDTSQVKVRFDAGSIASGSSVIGTSTYISTGFIFAKLGDT